MPNLVVQTGVVILQLNTPVPKGLWLFQRVYLKVGEGGTQSIHLEKEYDNHIYLEATTNPYTLLKEDQEKIMASINSEGSELSITLFNEETTSEEIPSVYVS